MDHRGCPPPPEQAATSACERIFEDTASGAGDRPALVDAFDHLRAGDTLVVWWLDRLGCSLKDLIARADKLGSQGVGLRSLKEAIDTDSSAGTWCSTSSVPWQSSSALIRERTQAGLKAAGARGRVGGGRKKLDAKRRAHVVDLYRSEKHTVKEICGLMGISRATVHSYLRERKA